MSGTTPSIMEALNAAMRDVAAVGKDGKNTSQGYSFRGVDAVVKAVGPAFRNHGIAVFPVVEEATYAVGEYGKNRTPMRECTLKVRFSFVGPAGDHLDAVVYAEANDSGDKATAKAHSVAFRTVLLQVLAIPTDEPEPDSLSYERSATPPPISASQSTALADDLASLTDDQAADLKAWWKAQRLPKSSELTAEQADYVLEHLAELPVPEPVEAS